jgi:hypothetical protein
MNEAYPVYAEDDITFAAGETLKDLRTELSSEPRALLFVGVYPGLDITARPVPVWMPWRGNISRARRSYGSRSMRLQGHWKLEFITSSTSARIVYVGYAPAVNVMVGDDDTPEQLPADLHEYIAQLAASTLIDSEMRTTTRSNPLTLRLAVLQERVESIGPEINKFTARVTGQWTERYS